MRTNLLLSNKYKKLGWVLLTPSFIIGIVLLITSFEVLQLKVTVPVIYANGFFEDSIYFGWYHTNIVPTLVGVLFIIGGLLILFSKEKCEDEYIAELRLSSLLWAVLVNFILLLISFLFIYGISFTSIMMYNMFTVLIIFIARFQYLIYRNTKCITDEK